MVGLITAFVSSIYYFCFLLPFQSLILLIQSLFLMHETRMYFNAVVLKYQNYLSTLPPLYAATPPGQRQRPRTIVAFDLCQQHVHIALVRLVTGLKNGFAFIKEEHLNSKRTNRFVTRTEEYFLMGGSTCCHPQTTRGYPVCLETILEILGPLQLDAIGHHSSF